jgi:hypothetical protein
MDGQRLFPDRHAITVPFMLNADEFSLYKAVTQYGPRQKICSTGLADAQL